ncbi:MAG: hypothetical protein R3F11_22340 [Verrucomicrobiales bacterium]
MSERYTIKQKLGEGGAGAVFLAYDNSLDREVALKRVGSAEGAEAVGGDAAGLLKEARALSALSHPNIVSVFDVEPG